MKPKASRLLLASQLVLCLTALPAMAVDRDFDNDSNDGLWSTGANWTGDTVPSGDNVFVNGNKTITLNYDAPTVNEVGLLRFFNGGSVTVNQTDGTLQVNSWFNLAQGWGGGGGTAKWNMSGDSVVNATHSSGGLTVIGVGFATSPAYDTGMLNIAGDATFNQTGAALFIGGEAGDKRAKGTVNVSDNGKLLSNQAFFVGVAGNGSVGALNLSGNSQVTTSFMHVGLTPDAYGAVNVAGGSLTVNGDTNIGSWGSGYQTNGGNGLVNVSSGTMAVNGWITMARWGGDQKAVLNVSGTGSVTYAGGGLVGNWNADGSDTSIITVSGNGSIATTNNTPINLSNNGSANNTGILNLNGGTITPSAVIGARGFVNFNGGTLRANSNNTNFLTVNTARVYSGGAIIDTNGKDITITQALLAPADNGVTTISVTDGGSGYVAAPILTISGGTGSGATAVANMVDDGTGNGTFKIGSITVTGAGSYTVAPDTINQTGGGATTQASGFTFGTAANVSGGLTKNGAGTLTLSANNTYGGTTLVTAGTLELSGNNGNGNLQVNGSGALTKITGGTTTVASTGGGSYISGGGSLEIAGGALVINGGAAWFSVGDHPILPDGNGTLTLTSGSFTNNNSWGITVGSGNAGTGIININGGAFTANDAIQNGIWLGESAGGNGTLNLNGGTLITDRIRVGASGTGTLNFNGGKLQATGDIVDIVENNANLTTTIQAGGLKVGGTPNFTISEAMGGTGGLTKEDGNTVTLSNTNTYTGATNVNGGTLIVNGSTAAGSTVTVASGATLGGIGTVGGATTISGTHAPGNSPGVQSFSGNLSYASTSIFEWDLASSATGSRGSQYDGVNVGGTLSGTSGAAFRVVLNSGAFTDAFWDANQTWSDIFKANADGSGSALNIQSVFSAIQWYQGATDMTSSTGTEGYFTVSGSSLTWTAVPEPSSALAGLLLTAGLLRRRR